MQIAIVTLFPELFAPFFATSLMGRAVSSGVVSVHYEDLRPHGLGMHLSVDDTPYVVTAATADDAGQVWIELNDQTRETLDTRSLAVGEGDVLYCRVKAGREWARFLRPAYYQLADRIVADAEGGFAFASATGCHPIGRR